MVPSFPLYTHPVLSFPCFSSEMHVKALTETYGLTEFLIFNILVKNYIFCSIWSTNCRLSTTNWKILAIVRTTLYTADCRLDTISYVSYNLRSRSWMFHKLQTFSKEEGKYYFIFAYTTQQWNLAHLVTWLVAINRAAIKVLVSFSNPCPDASEIPAPSSYAYHRKK